MIEVVAIVLGVFCVAIFVAHAVEAYLSRSKRRRLNSPHDSRKPAGARLPGRVEGAGPFAERIPSAG